MKITLYSILLLFLFVTSISYSQPTIKKYYGSGGFSFNFWNSDELNSIVDKYNSDPDIAKQMGKFDFFFGPNFTIGMNVIYKKSYLNIEFGFSFLFSGTKSAQYTTGVIRRIEDTQIQIPTINAGLNYFFKTAELFNIGAGFALNFGSLNVLNRDYNRASTTPDYTFINQNKFLGFIGVTPSLYFNFIFNKNFTLSVRPNYFVLLRSQDFNSLNSALNPGTTITGLNSSSMDGPGISLNLQFKLGR